MTQMIENVSDIIGHGYGDKHYWKRFETIQSPNPYFRETQYRCNNCSAMFWHQYHVIPDIFEAMKYKGIPEECGVTTNDLPIPTKSVDGWISVKDRLPGHMAFVLVRIPCGIMQVARCDISVGNYVFMSLDLRHQISKVTHWHLLPDQPKDI